METAETLRGRFVSDLAAFVLSCVSIASALVERYEMIVHLRAPRLILLLTDSFPQHISSASFSPLAHVCVCVCE